MTNRSGRSQAKTHDSWFTWADRHKVRLRDENQDLRVSINGQTGLGKSTLALILAFLFWPELSPENLHRYISWDSQTHKRLVETGHRYRPYILDEGEGLLGQDHNTTENKEFKKFLYRCRKLNRVQFILTPYWEAWEGIGKRKIFHARIEIPKKGEAVLKERGEDGGWENRFKAVFPSLEGEPIWEAYNELADRAARGEDVHQLDDPDAREQETKLQRIVRRATPKLEPLADIARREAIEDPLSDG